MQTAKRALPQRNAITNPGRAAIDYGQVHEQIFILAIELRKVALGYRAAALEQSAKLPHCDLAEIQAADKMIEWLEEKAEEAEIAQYEAEEKAEIRRLKGGAK